MKISIKLICLAIGMITLSSGCTKKNTKKQYVDQTNRSRNLDDKKSTPKKGDIPAPPPPDAAAPVAPAPQPNPESAPNGTPAVTQTPPPAAAAGTSSNGSTVVTPAAPAQTPVRPAQVPTGKSEIKVYNECITAQINDLLNVEKAKSAKLIEPKIILEIKTSASLKCAKPSIAADQIEVLLLDTLLKATNEKFPESAESIEFFEQGETSNLNEAERKAAYEAYKPQTATTPVTSATSVLPIPAALTMLTNKPAVANKPTAPAAPAGQVNTPVVTGPVAKVPPAVTPATPVEQPNMAALTAQIKECFSMRTNAFVKQFKNSGKTVMTPKNLHDLRTSASHICSVQILKEKDKQIDSQITAILVSIVNKELPQSIGTTKFYAETEAKNLTEENKKKLYSDYQIPATAAASAVPPEQIKKSSGTSPQPSAASAPALAQNSQLKPIEVKDIPAYEKCLNDTLFEVLNAAKKEYKAITSPIQIVPIANVLKNICKIQESTESQTALNRIFVNGILSSYPDSKLVMDQYLATEKNKNLSDEIKFYLHVFYNVGVEIQSKDVRLLGKLDPSNSSGNKVTYTLTKMSGTIQSKVQPIATESYNHSKSLEQIPLTNARFEFDFNIKSNLTGTLSVSEGQNKYALDFTVIEGNVAQLSSKQSIKVILTSQSWVKVIETDLRSIIVGDLKLDPKVPLKFIIPDRYAAQTRACELTSETVTCVDPQASAKVMVDLEEVKKMKIPAPPTK